jgi:hypothetical protein
VGETLGAPQRKGQKTVRVQKNAPRREEPDVAQACGSRNERFAGARAELENFYGAKYASMSIRFVDPAGMVRAWPG